MQKEQGLEEIRNVLILNTSSLSDVGLYGGKMGVSIFLAHYARYSNQDVYLDLVHSLIKEIFEDLDNSFSSNLEIGLSGIGWGVNYLLCHHFLSGDVNDVLFDLDQNLMRYDVRRINDFDFDRGLGGLVYYVNSRLMIQQGDQRPFDSLFLSDLLYVIKNNYNAWHNLSVKDVFFQYIDFLSDKPMKDCICSLPDFLKGKEIKITDSIYRMSLGLKNGLAGYGLNLMNI